MQRRQGVPSGLGGPPAYDELMPRRGGRAGTSPSSLLGRWHRLTAPADPPASASLAVRERARRGQLASTITLGLLVAELLVLPIGFTDRATLIAIVAGMCASVVALVLNRLGWVTAAGTLLAVVTGLALVGAVLGAPGGRLDLIYMPLFDLLVLTELIAVSVLPPASVFLVALVNSALILADVRFQPATPAFGALLGTPDGYTAVIRPIVLQIIVALVAYLWVRSTLQALRRADRAEEIAFLEQREAAQKRELEEGVRQLLAVHVEVANGNFQARTPPLRNPLLWQIGGSLNNLIARFARVGQGDFLLQRTREEAARLLEALRILRGGRQPIWPSLTGTAVDELNQFLYGWLTHPTGHVPGRPGGPPAAPAGLPPTSPANRRPGDAPSLPARPSAWPAPGTGLDPAADLPEWLRRPSLQSSPLSSAEGPWQDPSPPPSAHHPAADGALDEAWPDLFGEQSPPDSAAGR